MNKRNKKFINNIVNKINEQTGINDDFVNEFVSQLVLEVSKDLKKMEKWKQLNKHQNQNS